MDAFFSRRRPGPGFFPAKPVRREHKGAPVFVVSDVENRDDGVLQDSGDYLQIAAIDRFEF